MDRPFIFGMSRGHLIATPAIEGPMKVVYRSRSDLGLNGYDLGAFLEGYELAFARVCNQMRAIPVDASLGWMRNLLTLKYLTRSAFGCYAMEVSDALHARFPTLEYDIPMEIRMMCDTVIPRATPLDAGECARFGEHVAVVFPVFVIGFHPPDCEESRAIQRGFNNYAITEDHVLWRLRWPLE